MFFAPTGCVFAFTQYLQFAMGYGALEAGGDDAAAGAGLVLGAGASNHLSRRAGHTRVVAGGLFGVAAVLSTSLAWSLEMSPALLCLVTFGPALSMGFAMAPATATPRAALDRQPAAV